MPECDRALPPHDLPAVCVQTETAVFRINLKKPRSHQLTKHGMPLLFRKLSADPKSFDAVVAKLLHLWSWSAPQHINQVPSSKAFASASNHG